MFSLKRANLRNSQAAAQRRQVWNAVAINRRVVFSLFKSNNSKKGGGVIKEPLIKSHNVKHTNQRSVT